jgi:hypothetical protein
MVLNKKHRFVLYALYQYLREANKKYSDKPLEMSVSKSVFIEALKKTKIAEKGERALYKNLEILEKKKLVKYENKFLKPTEKGLKVFSAMHKEIFPFIHLIDTLRLESDSMTSRAQTYFK